CPQLVWCLPDRFPRGSPPASSTIRKPSPVLNLEPRTLANSHPCPRYRVRHSGFASNPPAATTIDFAPTTSSLPPSTSRAKTFTPSTTPLVRRKLNARVL